MKLRPANDDMIYPGMPSEKTIAQIRVWDEFLDPERHASMHYVDMNKIVDIVNMVRTVLSDEMHRHGSEYVAENIWVDGNVLNYSFQPANFDNGGRHRDTVGRQDFIVFETPADAQFFEITLHALIRLGLTKFTAHHGWNTVRGTQPLPRVDHLGVVK